MARTRRRYWTYDDHWNVLILLDGRDRKNRHCQCCGGATKHRRLRARATRQQVRQQIRAGMITTALLTSRRLALYY